MSKRFKPKQTLGVFTFFVLLFVLIENSFGAAYRSLNDGQTLFITEKHGLEISTQAVLSDRVSTFSKDDTVMKLGDFGITQTNFTNAQAALSFFKSKISSTSINDFASQLASLVKNRGLKGGWFDWYYWFKDNSDGKKKAVYLNITVASDGKKRISGFKIVNNNPVILYYKYYPRTVAAGLPQNWTYPSAGKLFKYVLNTQYQQIEPVVVVNTSGKYDPPACPAEGTCKVNPEAGLKKLIQEVVKPEVDNKGAIYAFIDYATQIEPKYNCDKNGNCTVETVVEVKNREARVATSSKIKTFFYYRVKYRYEDIRDDCYGYYHCANSLGNFWGRRYTACYPTVTTVNALPISFQDQPVQWAFQRTWCNKAHGWDWSLGFIYKIYKHTSYKTSKNPCAAPNKPFDSGTYTNSGTIGYLLETGINRYFVNKDGSYFLTSTTTQYISSPKENYTVTVHLPKGITPNQLKYYIIDPFAQKLHRTPKLYDFRHDVINGLACVKYVYGGRKCNVAPVRIIGIGGQGGSGKCVASGTFNAVTSEFESSYPDTWLLMELVGSCWWREGTTWWTRTCDGVKYYRNRLTGQYYQHAVVIPQHICEWQDPPSSCKYKAYKAIEGKVVREDEHYEWYDDEHPTVEYYYTVQWPMTKYRCTLDGQEYTTLKYCQQYCKTSGTANDSNSCILYP